MGFGVKTDERLRVLRGGRPSPTFTAPAACSRTMTPLKMSGSGVAGWQAAAILVEGWR